jgi:CheY-like chemotaxis protein
VLDVSKIVAGKVRLTVQPVDLAPVLADAVATIAPAADAKGVRVESIIDSEAPAVSGDPDRLQQIVWNLLSNAVKFTPRGGRVQLRLERVRSHVEIVVSDTGIGIPADFLPQVFERFRQADSRFGREYGGLGLGLSIVKQLVELHGGTVTAESGGRDHGATFRVDLPILAVRAESDRENGHIRPATTMLSVADSPINLGDLRVLVVDDEPDALELMADILSGAGAAVETASSGADALQRIAGRPPDVLLTDIGMPGMDGYGLIAEVRQSPDPAVRTTPAAALTAYARAEDRIRALRSGFQLHMAKPISPAELIAAVRALRPQR